MGGGKCTEMKLTAKEREEILKEIAAEAPEPDNDYVTIQEIARLLGTVNSNQMARNIKNAGYKKKKVFVSGHYHNALTIVDAKKFIAEWRARN